MKNNQYTKFSSQSEDFVVVQIILFILIVKISSMI